MDRPANTSTDRPTDKDDESEQLCNCCHFAINGTENQLTNNNNEFSTTDEDAAPSLPIEIRVFAPWPPPQTTPQQQPPPPTTTTPTSNRPSVQSNVDFSQLTEPNNPNPQICAHHLTSPLKLIISGDKQINIEANHFCIRSANQQNLKGHPDSVNTTANNTNDLNDRQNIHFAQYIMDLITPSDNKLSLKLFGSKKAVLKERKRQEREGRFIIHPCSAFRFYWDIIMLTLLMANVILLPLAIAFFHKNNNSPAWTTFNLVSDTLFLLDIIINFRTGVIVNNYVDEIILNPRQIAIHYVKGWFVIDALSSFPIDYIFLLLENNGNSYQLARTGRAIKAIRLFRLLSLLRLLRVSRLVRYATQWEEEFRSLFSVAAMAMRILNLIGLIMLIAHWNGCLQFIVPLLQDFPADCWVSINHLQNETWTKQYTLALFKALSHMLSIGYGRFPPQSYCDMWLTMLSMIVGAIVYATTIGHVSALVQSFDNSGRLYNEKIRQVEEYMVWRKLPRQLRSRIMEYYEHRYQGKMFDENRILNELSHRLFLDVVNHNCRSLVASVPFFSNAEQNFIDNIITKLEFEMFQPGDIIISAGSAGEKMYFIQEGIVDIVRSDGEVSTTLSDGSYFGEISLILQTKRTATVKAVTYCQLYSLSALHFHNILTDFPTVRRTIEVIASERLNKLGSDAPDTIELTKCLKEETALLKDIFRSHSSVFIDDDADDDDDSADAK